VPKESAGQAVKFVEALRRNLDVPKPTPLVEHYSPWEFKNVFAALDRLEGYERFIRAARDVKSRTRTSSLAFEGLVLDRADSASTDCDLVVESLLDIHKRAYVSGYLNPILRTLGKSLEGLGSVSISELVEAVTGDELHGRLLGRVPLRHEAIERVFSSAAKQSLEVASVEGGLEIKSVDGQAQYIRLPGPERSRKITLPKLVRGRTITEVLYGHPLDRFTAQHSPGLHGFDLVDSPDLDMPRVWTVDDLLVVVPLSAQAEMRRHVSIIRQVGLPLYEGNEGAVVLGLIIAAVFLIGWGIHELCEDADDVEQCWETVLGLLFIGLLLAGGGKRQTADPSTYIFSNPSPA
jgi:hypothetical protein